MLIKDILAATGHRPWPVPAGNFSWYQEWNRLLFFHFRVDAALIQSLIPAGLQIDTFDGSAWVSLVPFTMNRIRLRVITSFPPVSDFHEVNLRTYVTDGKHAGVYFFSLEASRWLPAWLARSISGMPYETAGITRSFGDINRYQVSNTRKSTFASVGYRPGAVIAHKTALQLWLTERYCVYLNKNNRWHRFQVHHTAWPLMELDLQEVQLEYRVGPQLITEKDVVSAQYSPGVQVLAWGRETL
jgi:uncharacterized protein YqjF (DUF2071 family)